MSASRIERQAFEWGQAKKSTAILFRRKTYRCPVCGFELPVSYILEEDGSCFACARLCALGREVMGR